MPFMELDMHRSLLSHPSIVYEQDMKDLCAPLALFNISSFANARVNLKGEFSTICNHPTFLTHYLEQGYHRADVSAKDEPIEVGDYLMWDMLDCRGKTANMLSDAALFNYRHIFTIVKKHTEYIDYYHFGTHLNLPSINQWYLNNLDKLQLFIDYFNNQLSQSKTLAIGHQITFPVLSPECQISGIENRSHEEQLFLKQISPASALSIRQHQCIELLTQGYSAKQIATQLNISHRTVEDHLNVLKHKLKAKNKSELIFKFLNDKKL